MDQDQKITLSKLSDQVNKLFNNIAIASRKKELRFIAYPLLALLIIKLLAYLVIPNPLFRVPYSRLLLDRSGELLAARIASDEQWRFPYPDKIPEKYEKALLTFEDSRFYLHPGFDPLAIIRALYLNFKHSKIISGGSTITMQVIRLHRHQPKRTVVEKIQEILLSFLLELRFSKSVILSLYAGHAPYGGNIIGLETAAWRYFARGADKLSWAESSLLAVLPNSPALIHPGRNRFLLKQKRDRLLRRLFEKGEIDELTYRLSTAEPLPEKPVPLPRNATHLLDTLILEYRKEEKNKYLFKSTINVNIQKRIETLLNQHAKQLRSRGIRNVAALVIDNKNAEVLAYVGNIKRTEVVSVLKTDRSRDTFDIDLITRPRSTGSILKPFLYAAMIDAGEILPTTLVADIPTQYRGYIPDNYDMRYRGMIPAKMALARSLNIPAVRMLQKYGLHRFYYFLQKFGMTTLFRKADDYGLTLILGGAEGKLWDLTLMYANLARLATLHSFSSIKRLKSEKLELKKYSGPGPGSAFLTMQAILEVTRPDVERFWRNFSSSQKIAWKTGTSYGARDAWAIGVTPRYTVGVWSGNADGEGVAGLSGVTVSAPLLFHIFNTLPKSNWFSPPSSHLKRITICRESGFLPTGSCDTSEVWVPAKSNFSELSPYHKLIHLDISGRWRVNSNCESTQNMIHQTWFVLPPVQEHYYRQNNPGYRTLPQIRHDCMKNHEGNRVQLISLEYPSVDSRIFIPIGLDGKPGKVIFRAIHRSAEKVIYWHLNDTYLGQTRTFHQFAVRPNPGRHKLVLVDEEGNRLVRRFEILGRAHKKNSPQSHRRHGDH